MANFFDRFDPEHDAFGADPGRVQETLQSWGVGAPEHPAANDPFGERSSPQLASQGLPRFQQPGDATKDPFGDFTSPRPMSDASSGFEPASLGEAVPDTEPYSPVMLRHRVPSDPSRPDIMDAARLDILKRLSAGHDDKVWGAIAAVPSAARADMAVHDSILQHLVGDATSSEESDRRLADAIARTAADYDRGREDWRRWTDQAQAAYPGVSSLGDKLKDALETYLAARFGRKVYRPTW